MESCSQERIAQQSFKMLEALEPEEATSEEDSPPPLIETGACPEKEDEGSSSEPTLKSIAKAQDDEVWAQLRQQLQSLHKNVQDFARSHIPPAVATPASSSAGRGIQAPTHNHRQPQTQ
ncbi:unnamed protein product, partial [Polarella glacialis]